MVPSVPASVIRLTKSATSVQVAAVAPGVLQAKGQLEAHILLPGPQRAIHSGSGILASFVPLCTAEP